MGKEQLTQADITSISSIYTELSTGGVPDGWKKDRQLANFQHLIKIVELSGSSLRNASCIDVGCGTGDFSSFWKEQGGGRYLGVDIYEPSLAIAKNKYPNEEFSLIDLLSGDLSERFDFGFASGTFNVYLPTLDNYDFLFAMIKKMQVLTKTGIAFNFLTDSVPNKIDGLFFYSTERVRLLCQESAPDCSISVEIDHTTQQAEAYVWKN